MNMYGPILPDIHQPFYQHQVELGVAGNPVGTIHCADLATVISHSGTFSSNSPKEHMTISAPRKSKRLGMFFGKYSSF